MKYLLISCRLVDGVSCASRDSVMKSNYVSNRRRSDYSDEVLHVRLDGARIRHSTLWPCAWKLRVAG